MIDLISQQIVEVVLAWLKHDWEHRQIHAVNLMKKLRLGLLPLDKLQELLGEEVLSIQECKAMVEEVRRLNATKEEADVPLIQSHPDMFASRNTVTVCIVSFSVEFLRIHNSMVVQLQEINFHCLDA